MSMFHERKYYNIMWINKLWAILVIQKIFEGVKIKLLINRMYSYIVNQW